MTLLLRACGTIAGYDSPWPGMAFLCEASIERRPMVAHSETGPKRPWGSSAHASPNLTSRAFAGGMGFRDSHRRTAWIPSPKCRRPVYDKPTITGQCLSDVRRLDETLRIRWIGLHFFFPFELSYQREPRSPIRTGLPRSAVGSHKNLLQTPHSLCRMVGCPLE